MAERSYVPSVVHDFVSATPEGFNFFRIDRTVSRDEWTALCDKAGRWVNNPTRWENGSTREQYLVVEEYLLLGEQIADPFEDFMESL